MRICNLLNNFAAPPLNLLKGACQKIKRCNEALIPAYIVGAVVAAAAFVCYKQLELTSLHRSLMNIADKKLDIRQNDFFVTRVISYYHSSQDPVSICPPYATSYKLEFDLDKENPDLQLLSSKVQKLFENATWCGMDSMSEFTYRAKQTYDEKTAGSLRNKAEFVICRSSFLDSWLSPWDSYTLTKLSANY